MSSQHLLLLLLLSLAASSTSAGSRHARVPYTLNPSIRNFVTNLCTKTDYKVACMNSARFYASSYRVVDIDAMIEMHIRLASSRLQEAKAAALSIAASSSPAEQGAGKGVIQDCISSYDDVADCLGAGLKAAKGGDQGTASSNLSSVFSLIGACDSDKYPILNPLHRKNQIIQKLASNTLAILSLKEPSS